jgi:hypothetical protein
VKARVSKPASVAEIMETIKKQIVVDTPHKSSAVVVSAKGRTDSNREEIEWRFTDDQGRAWIGSGLAESSKEKTGAFNVSVRLARGR